MVRPATFDDIPVLVRLGRSMHGESRFRSISFSETKLAQVLANLLKERMCVLVAERDGEVRGLFLGIVTQYYFSDEQLAIDLALFVEPGARGGMTGAALVRTFVAWAKERGIRHLELGVSTGVLVEETSALFERLGFKRQGSLFTMEIEDMEVV